MSRSPKQPCEPPGNRCELYWPGHNMHWIHSRHIGDTPWGWRDGVVEDLADDDWATVRYLVEDAEVRVWSHDLLRRVVRVGEPVRVHERYYALGGPFGWLNVATLGGLGPVPDPQSPDTWAAETTGSVVDLATGRALALDRPDELDGLDG